MAAGASNSGGGSGGSGAAGETSAAAAAAAASTSNKPTSAAQRTTAAAAAAAVSARERVTEWAATFRRKRGAGSGAGGVELISSGKGGAAYYRDQQQHGWSSDGSAGADDLDAAADGKALAGSGSPWTYADVAAAMGYGKRGRAGSAFQWWILAGAALLAVGSFVAWCVLVFRARDATQAALDAMGLVNLRWWANEKAMLLATAVCFPLFALAAAAVSLYRARLANELNIHAPDAAWARRCRRFQYLNVASSVALYGMLLLMVGSVASHAVWGFSARTAHYASYFAIKSIDPIWTGTASVVNASQNLVNEFVGLTAQLPGLGAGTGPSAATTGRRRLAAVVDATTGQAALLRPLEPADVAAMPPHVIDAGVRAARSLQQLPALVSGISGLLSGAANAINSVPLPQINAAALPALDFLPALLPNGTNNPLFETLRGVTDAVQTQLLNATGCPIYCVDLRNATWITDGCVCNLDRVKAAYPHIARIYSSTVPAMAMAYLMLIASSWLLLHAASQWARTRAEVKLLKRIPHAAKLTLTAAGNGGAAGNNNVLAGPDGMLPAVAAPATTQGQQPQPLYGSFGKGGSVGDDDDVGGVAGGSGSGGGKGKAAAHRTSNDDNV